MLLTVYYLESFPIGAQKVTPRIGDSDSLHAHINVKYFIIKPLKVLLIVNTECN